MSAASTPASPAGAGSGTQADVQSPRASCPLSHEETEFLVRRRPKTMTETGTSMTPSRVGTVRSPRAPSGPRVDSWSQFDGLSAGTKSFIFWTALLGLGALVLSFLFELAFFWLIGSCPTGETLVLKTNRNHVTDPHFLKRWSAIVATDVTRQCVPRRAIDAPAILFNRFRDVMADQVAMISAKGIKKAAQDVRARFRMSQREPCEAKVDEISSAVTTSCSRQGDEDVDDYLTEFEFSSFFACLQIPLECYDML